MIGSYLMMFDVGLFLKLVSFHHVMHDNRYLLRRLKKMDKKDLTENMAGFFGIPKETYEVALDYPKNLRVGHYIRFLCAPTCCY